MIIKKFQGKTEEEAVEAAKKELGNGIVIMNVKNVKRKGFFAALRSKLVEVTVALEDEKESLIKGQRDLVESASESVAKVIERMTGKTDENKMNLTPQGMNPESIEKKLDSLQILLEKQIRSNQAVQEKRSFDSEAGQEQDKAAEAEKMTDSVQKEENPEQEKFIRLLYNTMIDNEVDEKYANQMLEEIEKSKKPNIPMDYLLANIYQKMILKFGKSDGITPAEKGPKVVVFIGPTGVGKTTTIAKVASFFSVEEKKKVALVTADTYRIAAAEQLRTYANILETPFRVVYTAEELQKAIVDFKECDYIFLDTAGHSHQNAEQLEKMKELLDVIGELAPRETFLVLSATTKYKDLLKIAQNYKTITDYQLIFTKLDETATVGNLLNLKLYTDAPIAYVTHGQNVPDDIEKFNPQKTVKQLLGAKH